jgi:chromosomal replication initiation ATPase DnaA
MNETEKARIILDVACEYFGQDVDAVRSKSRNRELTDTRKAFALIASKLTRCSSSTIGLMIGKDHSTISAAKKEALNLAECNGFAEHFDAIEKRAVEIMKKVPVNAGNVGNY